MTQQDLIFLGACALVDCGRLTPLQSIDLAEAIYCACRPKPPSEGVAPGGLVGRLREFERQEIACALEESRGVVSIAARKLGMKRSTLAEKIKRQR